MNQDSTTFDLSNRFYDCTGRGRPRGIWVEMPSSLTPHFYAISNEDLTNLPSSESEPELLPPTVRLSTSHYSDQSDDIVPETNVSSSTMTKKQMETKSNNKTRSIGQLSIISPAIELPIKSDETSMNITLLPCSQFPQGYSSVTELIVEYWRRYHTRRVSFSQKEIGYFSTADRADRMRCREDYRYLKKLIFPFEQKNVHFDLNVGAEYLVVKEPPASLDAMMWWILQHKNDLYKNQKFTMDFFCWRGTLRKIMFSLFDSNLDWCIGIVRWRGCHFMSIFHTETELKLEEEHTPVEKRLQYWGHKFEDYLTSDSPSMIPSPTKIFCTMNRATLGRHTLLYSCEIDVCTIDSTFDGKIDQKSYVEVKTVCAKHLLDLNTASSRKYAKWWQQCFLAGIHRMFLGFRDNYGIVEHLQPLSVRDVEIRAKTWSASAFVSFLDEFCSFVQRTITKEWSPDDNDTYLFYYSPKSKKIQWRTVNDAKYQFMPKWFIQEFS